VDCWGTVQEVLGMDFHVTQPGSSVATSLVAGEAKPKHVLLLEIKGNRYRPTKIPLGSVRPFEFMDVSLKDQPDLDPNDQTAVLEYLGKVVSVVYIVCYCQSFIVSNWNPGQSFEN
jgi:double-strand break repair protein MRE11